MIFVLQIHQLKENRSQHARFRSRFVRIEMVPFTPVWTGIILESITCVFSRDAWNTQLLSLHILEPDLDQLHVSEKRDACMVTNNKGL